MIRTGVGNDLSDLNKLGGVLREQFGSYHERELRGKGRGHGHARMDYGKRSWYGSSSGRTSYLSDGFQATTTSTAAASEYDESQNDHQEYEGYDDTSQIYDDDFDAACLRSGSNCSSKAPRSCLAPSAFAKVVKPSFFAT